MSNCQPVHEIVGELWNAYSSTAESLGVAIGTAAGQPALVAGIVDAAGKAREVSEAMVSFWNSNIAKNSWATIGPRRLDFNTTLKGKLVSTGGRWFVCPEVSIHDRIRIEVWERSGKAKTEISFHLMNPASGTCRDEGNYLLNEDRDEKKDTRQHITRVISNAKGQVALVHLDAKSVANTFEYEVRLSSV